ncbi:uncharacterized protein LOC115448580 [Manduca sexta]|uniref:uncharacterized protein LOC115448580 n=1 Tax=Manduca sexta TaxID=7130 RepID=UPI00188F8783|nr:uncharacterized protein LOC115448580 [Manduca sexta]XP_037293268.1 uncharacterized protein LOC115448580 [Manduca sexta]
MSSFTPIILVGENLGLRHRHLNSVVTEAIQQCVPFQQIQDLPEQTPVDRLFKIDLASKLRNVDYILQNIKDEDMLYVSRALKAKWLLEQQHQSIIHPKYLEENLYPYMVTTAVSKFKNWLYLHLKDPQRCEDFYIYYSESNFNYAIKFLGRCHVKFIILEAPNILEKLSPHHFKILCEKCPQVAKIYFDNILDNDELKEKFLDNHQGFYNSLKVVLKLDADIFFEITEKYFDNRYNRSLTKHIMAHHREKFEKKPELYASMLLNTRALAEYLSSEESKELVLKLVRATYLNRQIDYKYVEPLIMRLPIKERSAFKNLVFVEKTIGELVKAWPYDKPCLPSRKSYYFHVFEDRKPSEYNTCCMEDDFRCMLKKRKFGKYCARMDCYQIPRRTYLDKLFDEYRFFSFERALFELRKKIKKESSAQNRQYIMLVLVSKSGGQPELVAKLLQLLEQHCNEPTNVRATVVRSLVKRAAVWRLPQHSWDALLEFARGLGLDGSESEADCREGLHAVVIRSLLETGACEPAIREAFLKDFSNLDEYATNSEERKIVKQKLPELLLAAANAQSSPVKQVELLTSLLNMLQQYKADIGGSALIPAVAVLAKRDSSAAEGLLRRLFNAKIARKTLFREFFPLIQTDASYLNALRHDTSVLNVSTFIDLVERDEIRPEQFLRKMAIYFAESSGMTEHYITEMRQRILNNKSVGKSIARPLCILQGACLGYLVSLDSNNKSLKCLAAAIRANMYAGRPKLDINSTALSAAGAKAVANKVLVCPIADIDKYVHDLLTWKRTVRVALVLAERTGKEADAFITAATLRPTATLKAALKYFHSRPDFDPRVWDVFKQLIMNFNLSSEKHVHFRKALLKLDGIPLKIKPEYCELIFKALKKERCQDAIKILSNIEALLRDINENFIENLLLDFLQEFDPQTYKKNDRVTDTHLRMLVKCLLLCKSEEIQKSRFEILGTRFLQFLTVLCDKLGGDFFNVFKEVLINLQLNQVFLDDTYVSPLPVMENILSWMRHSLPIELNFDLYVRIHLSMMYFKSIRQGLKSQPDIFNNEKRKLSEGPSVVGYIFGRKIAREIKQLKESYFESAIDLYHNGIKGYFSEYFLYDDSKFKFMKAVIKGILEGSVADEARVALYLLENERYNLKHEDIKELYGIMKNIEDEKFRYFLFADVSENPLYC